MWYLMILKKFPVNPVINVPNQLIWSTMGNNFTMECNVEAFPRSVNYWIRGDGIKHWFDNIWKPK